MTVTFGSARGIFLILSLGNSGLSLSHVVFLFFLFGRDAIFCCSIFFFFFRIEFVINIISAFLKVFIAQSRSSARHRDVEDEELTRIFVMIPKTFTEEDLKDTFKVIKRNKKRKGYTRLLNIIDLILTPVSLVFRNMVTLSTA